MYSIDEFQRAEAHFYSIISSERMQTEHVLAFATGVQSPTLNHAVIHHVDEQFRQSLIACCDFYANKAVPWEIGVPDKHYQQLHHTLQQHGFVETDTGVAMGLLLQSVKKSPVSTALVMKIMDDDVEGWSVPVMLGFESTPDRMAPYTFRHLSAVQTGQPIVHFSGFIDHQAVCSLTLTFGDGNVRVDDVATTPQHQRQGYATQLLLAALEHASGLGAQYGFLEASNSGLSVYNNIGFERLFTTHYFEMA